MTSRETLAVMVADKYVGDLKTIDKLKKLGEELVEFTEAVLKGNEENIKEEAGDMCFIILHICHQLINDNEVNIMDFISVAADKMERRNK